MASAARVTGSASAQSPQRSSRIAPPAQPARRRRPTTTSPRHGFGPGQYPPAPFVVGRASRGRAPREGLALGAMGVAPPGARVAVSLFDRYSIPLKEQTRAALE